MNRRWFLGAIASIPFVGKAIANSEHVTIPEPVSPSPNAVIIQAGEPLWIGDVVTIRNGKVFRATELKNSVTWHARVTCSEGAWLALQ